MLFNLMVNINIYIDGVFDLFHMGHVKLFQNAIIYAKQEFPNKNIFLIVGVVLDKDVESYKRKSIMTFEERIEIVKTCRYVDKVITAELYLTDKFLIENKIDLVFHGNDSLQSDFFKVPLDKGIMRYLPYTASISTTDLINRCFNYANNN